MEKPTSVVTWNVNGIRRILRQQQMKLCDFLVSLSADIICFQETKLKRTDLDEELACPPGTLPQLHRATCDQYLIIYYMYAHLGFFAFYSFSESKLGAHLCSFAFYPTTPTPRAPARRLLWCRNILSGIDASDCCRGG